jgi:hypothetical protein
MRQAVLDLEESMIRQVANAARSSQPHNCKMQRP